MDVLKKHPERFAMFFHCQTALVGTFRDIYPDRFEFEGNRALVFSHGKPLPVELLKHYFAMALTCHLKADVRLQRQGI